MTIQEFYRSFASDCTAGCGNQLLTRLEAPVTKTGRCWFRLSHGGENYALLFSNQIDSTYDDGSISKANDVGGEWQIESMRLGLCKSVGEAPLTWQQVTFEGEKRRVVSDPDAFATDPIPLHAKARDYLCYEITLTGSCYPYHEEAVLTMVPDKQMPLPLMIGCDRPVSQKIGFRATPSPRAAARRMIPTPIGWRRLRKTYPQISASGIWASVTPGQRTQPLTAAGWHGQSSAIPCMCASVSTMCCGAEKQKAFCRI